MTNKFTDEDIKEIVSKLKWKPYQSTYVLFIVIILMIISLLCILIYLILNQKNLKCETQNLKTQIQKIENSLNIVTSSFENKTNSLEELLLDNSNEIRYLSSTSGRKMKNLNLLQRSGHEQPIFSNEIEDIALYSASLGN